MHVAAYVRYSSDNQRNESIDAQLRAIEDYAERHKMTIAKVYADRAKTATSDKREGFQRMIADSAIGLFQAVVVHKLDRFSRDKYDNVLYKRKLKKNGVRVISVTENLDGSPESIILESLLEGMAEYYSKNLAREVMKGMLENAYKCKHTGGTPPLGYDVTPEKDYVINEAEAEIIRQIFALYLAGHGYISIIKRLNEQGYKTKRGNSFGKNSLHDIIANEKYCGTYVFNRVASKDAFGMRNSHKEKPGNEIIRIEGGMPAIISKEDFELAKAMMAKNKHRAGRYKAKQQYLLSGLIVCGECGYAMQGNARVAGRNKERYISYRCGNRDRKNACLNKELRKEYIEQFVLSELEKKLFNDEAIPYLVKRLNEHQESTKTNKQKEIRELEKRIRSVEKETDNIVSAISQGFVQEIFKEKLVSLEKEKAEIKIAMSELNPAEEVPYLDEDSIRQLLSMFRQYVLERNIPECKRFIDSYVGKVVVFREYVEVYLKFAVDEKRANSTVIIKSSTKKKSLFKKYR